MGNSVHIEFNDICPFCGSDDTHMNSYLMSRDGYEFWVSCDECVCTGPNSNTEKKAAEAWNKARRKADIET